MKRTAEFVVGLIGGILGILAALSGVFFGAIATALEVDGGNVVSGASWIAVALSVIGIIGAAMVKNKTMLASILMLIAAIGGFICISMLFILPGVLLLIAGIMGLVRKDRSTAGA
ncbi:MAG: DUF4064 domain-containing protein [Tumebacillaceae bacterium]